MKRLSLILFFAVAVPVFVWSKKNRVQTVDDVFARTIANRDAMNAFRATIEDIDSQGERRADIEYTVDGLDWVMKNATTDDTLFEWRKIDEDLYVLNADTGWFWKIEHSSTSLPIRVDPQDAINEVQTLLLKKTLQVTRMGSEPCGTHLCWRYRLVESSFAIVERYWFLDATEFRLVKDQFVLENGETSITTYDYESKIEIGTPRVVNDVPVGAEIMNLPGIVKNLSTPKP